jgi:NTP pyrophosphatase (non-canonical NTP hydrolase)
MGVWHLRISRAAAAAFLRCAAFCSPGEGRRKLDSPQQAHVAPHRRLSDSVRMRDLEELRRRVREFVAERDWERFHSPKNLAMALSVEAAELVELFQWLTEEESAAPDAERRRRVGEEMADVLWFLVRIADRLDIDLLAAAEAKLAANAAKYPAERVRGQSKKYDEY